MTLSNLEYDILGAVYFVESFDNILAECDEKENIVADVLKSLIQRKYVTAMVFDQEKTEYVKSFIYDSDNMRAYYYLATRDGLLKHNSR